MPSGKVLDRPIARIVALGIVLLMIASLAWLHRDRLWPAEPTAASGDDPASRCLAQRAADIDAMLADGTVTSAQAALFKTRAEALCRAQAAPSGPGLTPPAAGGSP